MSENKLAVVLIRGTVNIGPEVKKTLELLRLKKKHACVVIDDNEVSRGMLQRVKDYVTYGTIDEAFFKRMLEKRGEPLGNTNDGKFDFAKISKEYFADKIKLRDFEEKGVKPYFRLHPPIGGYERAGIKMPFTKGGVLGNRAEKINLLIEKML